MAKSDKTDFFVVIPFYNEEKSLIKTLESLTRQSNLAFTLVLVNNASTDHTMAVVETFKATNPPFPVDCIFEPQKGTGTAADAGFRYAIAQGAKYIARTDADCLPDLDWIKNIKYGFEQENLEFVIGKIKAREDEFKLSLKDRLILPVVVWVAENFGKLLRHGKQFKYVYIMVAGNNLGITADLYERAGGFPHSRIEEAHEDKILSEKIRTMTKQVKKKNNVIVYNSIRRAKAYGYWNSLMWYWDHKYKPHEIDIR
jgi:glycosyltransferase involved in cell wall biosynthesis